MRTHAFSPLATLAGVWLLASAAPPAAAVELCPISGCDPLAQSMPSTEEPDPLGLWALIHDLAFPYRLDPDGPFGDPSMTLQAVTRAPVVVWATATRADQDIALCEWSGAGWRPKTLLASSIEDDRDPRIASAADGTLHVVWWQPARERVLWITRLAGHNEWNAPRTIAAARRPSVVITRDGETIIGYERVTALGRQVVVWSQRNGAAPVEVVIATTSRTKPLDVRVHSASGSVWVDWKHADGRLAYTRRAQASWQPTLNLVAWTEGPWLEEEQIRDDVRGLVLAAPVP